MDRLAGQNVRLAGCHAIDIAGEFVVTPDRDVALKIGDAAYPIQPMLAAEDGLPILRDILARSAPASGVGWLQRLANAREAGVLAIDHARLAAVAAKVMRNGLRSQREQACTGAVRLDNTQLAEAGQFVSRSASGTSPWRKRPRADRSAEARERPPNGRAEAEAPPAGRFPFWVRSGSEIVCARRASSICCCGRGRSVRSRCGQNSSQNVESSR